MKKKFVSVILACVLFLSYVNALPARADTITDSSTKLVFNTDTGTITGYTGYSTNLTIPATISGVPVVRIADTAFYNKSTLQSVAIPNGVTYIGSEAFCNCTSLASITVPESVTTLGGALFLGDTALTAINVDGANANFKSDGGVLYDATMATLIEYPAGKADSSFTVPDGVTSISQAAFWEAPFLSITLPSSLTQIGVSAFYGCTSLGSVTIPSGVTQIAGSVFYNCTAITAISLPSTVTTIGNSAFYDCNKLTDITLPSGVTEIDNLAFFGCSSLESVTIPGGILTIPTQAFDSCYALQTVVIQNGVTGIGQGAFQNCDSLTSVTIPGSIVSFADYAFSYCSHLTSINFPEGLTSIGGHTFQACTSLTAFNVDPNNANYASADGVLFNKTKTSIMIYPGGNARTSYTVPDGVTGIYNYAFQYARNLTSVTFPQSLQFIGNYAFIGCTSLSSINIFYGITSVGSYAFSGTALTTVVLPGSLTQLGAGAFSNCTALTSLVIPGNVTSLGDDVAYGCPSIVLYGTAGSQAQIYASQKSISFKVISSVVMKSDPAKIGYAQGETLNLTGAAITVTFGDSSTADLDVTPVMVRGYNASSVSTQSITVNYGGVSTSFTVCVAVATPVSLTASPAANAGISLSWSLPQGIGDYEVYRSPSASGPFSMIATTTVPSYSDTGLSTEAPYYYKVRAFVSCAGNTVYSSFSSVASASTSAPPVITIAPYSTAPTNQNITVTASADTGVLNAESHTFTENGSFDFVATDAVGNVTTRTVIITNISKNMTGLVLKSNPTRTTYVIGQNIDVTDAVITAIFDNSATEDVIVTPDMISGYDSGTSGNQTIMVNYNGYHTSFMVTVVLPHVSVSYQGHVQNIGWQSPVIDGGLCGTTGQGLRVEALKINLENAPAGLHIEYCAHVQNIGWQSWVEDGTMAGTSGQSLQVEAIQIKLVGTDSQYYSVEYQAHVQNVGWQDWVKDGEIAGTSGQSLRIEALRIKIVPKIPDVSYSSHVQNIGWQSSVSDGDISGTSGQCLRVEALKISLENAPSGLHIEYRAHVQNIGWQNWVEDGVMAGTSGQSLRVEAVEIKLVGTNADEYSVEYQAHVQNVGWQDWVRDGAMAGTSGQSLRVEAIRIKIVEKQ